MPPEAAVIYQEDGNHVSFLINDQITDLDEVLRTLSLTCTSVASYWRATDGGPPPRHVRFRRGTTYRDAPAILEDQDGDLTYTVRPDLDLDEALHALGGVVDHAIQSHYTRHGLRAVG